MVKTLGAVALAVALLPLLGGCDSYKEPSADTKERYMKMYEQQKNNRGDGLKRPGGPGSGPGGGTSSAPGGGSTKAAEGGSGNGPGSH